eukprot:1701567-Amphidinium_carterae.1
MSTKNRVIAEVCGQGDNMAATPPPPPSPPPPPHPLMIHAPENAMSVQLARHLANDLKLHPVGIA